MRKSTYISIISLFPFVRVYECLQLHYQWLCDPNNKHIGFAYRETAVGGIGFLLWGCDYTSVSYR